MEPTFHQWINSTDRYGDIPLHKAVKESNSKKVYELLQYDELKLGIENDAGLTPIAIAVTINTTEAPDICRWLLEKGANICTCDFDMSGPLHLAAFAGCDWAVSMLLEAHSQNMVKILKANLNRRTPLSLAVEAYMSHVEAQARNNENPDPEIEKFDVDPTTVRLLLDASIIAQRQNPMFWIDYPSSDPVLVFFSDFIPKCVSKKITHDGLDCYYFKDNIVHKSQYKFGSRNLLGWVW